jgi:hypothetical protein
VPDRVVTAIERLLEDLGVDIVEARVLRFVVQEIHDGKTLEQALAEPYVINNTTEVWRREMLERPEVVNAVEEEIEKAFKARGGE